MSIKGAFKQMIGKRIKGVVVKEGSGSPPAQIFLLFSDDTYFEFYGNSMSGCNGVDPGNIDTVRSYMAGPGREITFESVDESISSAASETKAQKPTDSTKPTLAQWMESVKQALAASKPVPQRVIDDFVARGGKMPERRTKEYSQPQSKTSQDEKMDKLTREDYAAELRARPVSTWAKMPQMISILSGATNRSGKPKVMGNGPVPIAEPTLNMLKESSMNIYQRIVLVLGAIALLMVFLNSPTVQYANNGMVLPGGRFEHLANIVDMKTALVSGLTVIAVTILIFFAFKSNGKGKKIHEESKKE